MKKNFIIVSIFIAGAITAVLVQIDQPKHSGEKATIEIEPVLSTAIEPSAVLVPNAAAIDNTTIESDSESVPASPAEQQASENGSATDAGLNAWEVAQGPLTDDVYYSIVNFLKKDPDFLRAVMTEFQGESDLDRQQKLATLLSEISDPSITTLAADMVASGSLDSKKAALSLLGKIQHRDPQAQQIVLQVISARTDEPVLVAALNAMANTNREQDTALRADIINHISPLTQHSNAPVRRHSYAMLFRWADDADMNYLLPQLRAGLRDSDPGVRRSTAFGFVNSPQNDESTKLELFTMLNNQNEIIRNRKAAASALKRMVLAADEIKHIDAVLKSLPRRKISS